LIAGNVPPHLLRMLGSYQVHINEAFILVINYWYSVSPFPPSLPPSPPPHNAQDWRVHYEQMHAHKEGIESTLSETRVYLDKLHQEISKTLEKITSREKYINNQVRLYVHGASVHARYVCTCTVRLYMHGASVHARYVCTCTVRLYMHGTSVHARYVCTCT